MSQFDPADYWENRLDADFALRSVGRINWGPYFNWWAYRIRRMVFTRLVRSLGIDFQSVDALDVGTGTGFYIDCWRQQGVRSVTGADITDVAVGNLRRRYPNIEFHVVDIGGDLGPLCCRRFDAVSCMDVLFHIVDDARYQRAFENINSILRPGGLLIFSEGFVHGPARRSTHIVHRPLCEIENVVRAAGFRIVQRRPFLVLMNDPVEPGTPLLRIYWRLSQIVVQQVHLAGAVLGAALYPLEATLVSLLRESPSTEVMVCRREGDDR
jgi:SAM-dependent methyltransferase